MKRPKLLPCLIVLLPPTLICLGIWTQTRIGPREYQTRLWHLFYSIQATDTQLESNLFEQVLEDAVARDAEQPDTVTEFEVPITEEESPELLARVKALGLQLPAGSQLYYKWEQQDPDVPWKSFGLTLYGNASLPDHHLLTQHFAEAQTGNPNDLQRRPGTVNGAWRERDYALPRVHGSRWAISTKVYWKLEQEPPRPVRALSIYKKGGSSASSNPRIFRLGKLTIRRTGLNYTGPVIPYLFPLLTTVSLFLYILRKPFLRLLRLPTRLRSAAAKNHP